MVLFFGVYGRLSTEPCQRREPHQEDLLSAGDHADRTHPIKSVFPCARRDPAGLHDDLEGRLSQLAVFVSPFCTFADHVSEPRDRNDFCEPVPFSPRLSEVAGNCVVSRSFYFAGYLFNRYDPGKIEAILFFKSDRRGSFGRSLVSV